MGKKQAIVPVDRIERSILLIRGQKVILDADLAELYGVPTRTLIQAIKRNINRFPSDFTFLLTRQEVTNLRSQIVTSSWGGRRHLPRVFTEHGAIMAASVLNSRRAIEVSVFVVRAFVKLKEMASTHRALAQKLAELEHRIEGHDEQIQSLLEAIRRLMALPEPPRRRIGFHGAG